jgi:hypothetical protein
MKKLTIIILGCIITAGISIYIGHIIYNNIKNVPNENVITEISEVIEDDCTDEYKYEQKNIDLLKTNSEEEKISPNAIIKLKKHYNKCDHTIVEEKSINSNLVNKTKLELQEEYEGWKIEKFSTGEIILVREFEGKCNEEFILRDVNGKIVIYKLNENNQEIEYEKTDISTDYLTQTDKNNINNGLKVIGIWELNKVIEDFE